MAASDFLLVWMSHSCAFRVSMEGIPVCLVFWFVRSKEVFVGLMVVSVSVALVGRAAKRHKAAMQNLIKTLFG